MMRLLLLRRFAYLLIALIGIRLLAYPLLNYALVQTKVQTFNRELCCVTPIDFGMEYEEVSFTSKDGVALHGWYTPPQNGAVIVLLHGYDSDRTLMLPRAYQLNQAGFGVLLYDLRGHGESIYYRRSMGWEDVPDVMAALTYLQENAGITPEHIGIFGFSIGGQIALRATAQTEAIQAVMVDGAGFASVEDIPPDAPLLARVDGWLTFQMLSRQLEMPAVVGVVAQLNEIAPRPVFFVTAGGEFPLGEYYYEQAREPKSFWQIPEATHGDGLTLRPEEYSDRMITFFQQELLE